MESLENIMIEIQACAKNEKRSTHQTAGDHHVALVKATSKLATSLSGDCVFDESHQRTSQ